MYERPDLASALASFLLPETAPAETEAGMLEDDWCERPDLACAMVWEETAPVEEEQREMNSLMADLGLGSSTLLETSRAEHRGPSR